MTLTFIFNVKQLLDNHLLFKITQATDVPGRFVSTSTARVVELLLLHIAGILTDDCSTQSSTDDSIFTGFRFIPRFFTTSRVEVNVGAFPIAKPVELCTTNDMLLGRLLGVHFATQIREIGTTSVYTLYTCIISDGGVMHCLMF